MNFIKKFSMLNRPFVNAEGVRVPILLSNYYKNNIYIKKLVSINIHEIKITPNFTSKR